jgi:hypothetical protein
VLALSSDLHADAVVYHLSKLGVPVLRIDPTLDESVPSNVSIKSGTVFSMGYEFGNGKIFDLNGCMSVFCRFSLEMLSASSDDPVKRFSQNESLTAFLAPLRTIEPARWINDPWLESRADCKILQTKIANEIGLKVPDFIMSSNYTDAQEFCNTHRKVVIKALSDTPLAYSEGKFKNPEDLDTADFAAPYTAKLPSFDEKIMSRLDGSPCFIQEEIIKVSDIRVTVIDEQIFAVEIPYKEGRPIDFRQAPVDEMKPIVLSENIEKKTIELLEKMRVRFASCDFICDVKDNIYFLEANVQGNWLWTETDDFHISRAIAKALTNGV